MNIDLFELLMLCITGFGAGLLGGLMGIGGSVVMIPAMAVLFENRAWGNQHLYQASAMIVNIFVALPATLRHHRAGAIDGSLLKIMLPITGVSIIAGVLVSNLLSGGVLRVVFAVFLVYVVFFVLRQIAQKAEDHDESDAMITLPKAGLAGAIMGFSAGLLGIGGGIIVVPLLHMLCRLPLRRCIAASAATMCITSVVGAALKVGTLPTVGASPRDALVLGAILIPTALAGGYLGGGLTHRIALTPMRVIFALVTLLAAARMGGLL